MNIRPENFTNRLVLKSDPSSVHDARKSVEQYLRDCQVSDSFLFNMCLVVSEAVANAVSHGSNSTASEVALSFQIRDGVFQVLVEDFQGRMFDPEYFRRIAMVKDWGKGGRGIMMMEMMVDNMSYLIEEGKHTLLLLEKALPVDHAAELGKP